MANPTGKGLPKGSPRTLKTKQAEAKERVIALIAAGHSVEAAMTAVGRKKPTYQMWRNTDSVFKNRIDVIRRDGGEKGPSDFVTFRKTYFGHDTFHHQQQLIDAIENAEPMSITLILLPPEWGKTTTLEDYICYILGAVDPNRRFCILSEAKSHAKKILGRVSRRMTDRTQHANYIDQFGPFKPPDREQQKPWNTEMLTIVHNTDDERDPSLEVKSVGSTIYGARYDIIVLDDSQSTKNLTQTEAILEYIRQDVITRAGQSGKIIVIGTRVGQGDVYEAMMEEDDDGDTFADNIVIIPALDEKGRSNFPPVLDEDGNQVMVGGKPLGWSEEALAKRRKKVKEATWSRVYQQDPASGKNTTFSEEVIERCKNHERTIWVPGPPGCEKRTPPVPGLQVIGMLDPALAGHCIHRIASFDYEKFYLLDGCNNEGLTKYTEIWDLIEDYSEKWHPGVWVMEGNSLQSGLITDERLIALSEKYGFRIEAHQTGKNKRDEDIGVASMEGYFKRGEIEIPWGDEPTRAAFEQLPKELIKWKFGVPTKLLVQDEVMALWFGYLYWQRQRATLATKINRKTTTRGLPYKPTGYPRRRRAA